jgi:hypothetical protein
MRRALLILILLAAGPTAKSRAEPNQNRNAFVCGTTETTEQLNARLTREGLAAKGVEQMTTYCLSDIKSLWNACAKSKGTKRTYWCNQLTSYCNELARQDEAKYQAYVAEKTRKNNEREERRRRMMVENPMAYALSPYDYGNNNVMEMLQNMKETPPVECYGPPADPEAKKTAPSKSSSPTANEILLEIYLNRMNRAMGPNLNFPPQPSYDPGDTPRSFNFSGPNDSGSCMQSKIRCRNNCNAPSYGLPKDYAAIDNCRAGCENICQ